MGWDSSVADIMVLAQTNQVMHVQVNFKLDKRVMFISVVYADNYYMKRLEVWASLCHHKVFIRDAPWVVMGDFNQTLNLEDNLHGSLSIPIGMREFKECVNDIEALDVKSIGIHYTWNQKPKHGNGTFKKLDRIMSNIFFTDESPASSAIFHPYGISDHSPRILKVAGLNRLKHSPFKFANFLTHKK